MYILNVPLNRGNDERFEATDKLPYSRAVQFARRSSIVLIIHVYAPRYKNNETRNCECNAIDVCVSLRATLPSTVIF